jgi:ABC-type branched-subunit amino acid transport system substrate-binding protein
MKKAGWIIATVFLFTVLVSSVASAKPIAGLLFPISGPFSAMGTDMRNGSLIAIEELNAKGGVLGKPIEVIIGDDELKAAVALRKYKEMVDGEGIKFIGGTLSGAVSVAVNEWACKNQVVYMSFCHTSIPLGKEQCGYGFVSGMIPYRLFFCNRPFRFQLFTCSARPA